MSSDIPASALTVEIVRDPAVESRHTVHAVLMSGNGKTQATYGDARRLTFPRSTLKPLQAVALLESGAAEAFQLSDAEIALACASHSGEEKHIKAVSHWLQRLGLKDSALECGAHAPYNDARQTGSVLHNNCSGKHAGMLTLALFLKAPLQGYTKPEHPVQQLILKVLTRLCGTELTPACCCVDGCSAPNPAMPLENLAQGFADFMREENDAYRRIMQAMIKHPDLVGGTGRLDTVLMQAAAGKIISKGGAEGTYIALVPERDMVIALKAEDGASRAAHAALYHLLEKHELADKKTLESIRPLALPVLKNWRQVETGRVRI